MKYTPILFPLYVFIYHTITRVNFRIPFRLVSVGLLAVVMLPNQIKVLYSVI